MHANRGRRVKPGHRVRLARRAKQANRVRPGQEGPPGPQGEAGEQGPAGKVGPQGLPGNRGSPKSLPVTGRELTSAKAANTSYAACNTDEVVSGGGFEMIGAISPQTSYVLQANRPSLSVTVQEEKGEVTAYPAPQDGTAASGWAVTIENASGPKLSFRSNVMCTVPDSGKEISTLEQANGGQELQQILQLLHSKVSVGALDHGATTTHFLSDTRGSATSWTDF